jgi:Skp family chaperone for outer membrane proteins
LETLLVTQNVRFRLLFAALAASLGLMLAAHTADAQTTQTTPAAPAAPAAAPAQSIPVVVGILDTEAVVLGSSAGKSLTTQANAQLKALQDATQKQEDALIAKVKQLETLRRANPPQVTEEQYGQQRQALVAQDDQLRSNFEKNKEALDQKVEKARQSLLQAATKVIQDIAKQRGLTLIIARNSAPLFPEQWNITPDVVARLNKALPSIKL